MEENELRSIVMGYVDAVPQPYDEILKKDGFEAVCAICDLLGGSSVYIPTKQSIFRRCLASARDEFNGQNFRALQKKYGYSESNLRKILREVRAASA